jgi:hypothetical protein
MDYANDGWDYEVKSPTLKELKTPKSSPNNIKSALAVIKRVQGQ